ncbi:hypothetical protein M426DRAFT_11592 [Hypoxylon sp. CI-4A]|nr:hypothetical protein M426DRAFT_11592 [Hypoxylon sp. CI-4A]
MASTKPFRFLDLPPELRSAILTQVLVSESSILLYDTTFLHPPLDAPSSFLNVFLVNTQLYQEASPIFYSQNLFTLNAHSHRLPAHLTRRGGFLSEEGRDARRRVRSLSLFISRVGGEFERVLGPAMSDMVLSGNLRDLRLRLGPPSTVGAGRVPDPDVVHRPPFQALLRLLADPYLETAELFVWKVHSAVFCPFHQNGGPETRPDNGESVSEQGLAILRSSSGWVELDWKAIVDAYGEGQQIVRIGDRCY